MAKKLSAQSKRMDQKYISLAEYAGNKPLQRAVSSALEGGKMILKAAVMVSDGPRAWNRIMNSSSRANLSPLEFMCKMERRFKEK